MNGFRKKYINIPEKEVFMKHDRLLCEVRNISEGTEVISSDVVKRKALQLRVARPTLEEFLDTLKVKDDQQQSGYSYFVAEEQRAELQKIFEGGSGRWHFWKTRVYRQHLAFNFIGIGRWPDAEVLSYFTDWPDRMKLEVVSPENGQSYFINFTREEALKFAQLEVKLKENGLIYTDAYEVCPERG